MSQDTHISSPRGIKIAKAKNVNDSSRLIENLRIRQLYSSVPFIILQIKGFFPGILKYFPKKTKIHVSTPIVRDVKDI